MDEIEQMVAETFRHFHENNPHYDEVKKPESVNAIPEDGLEYPECSGVLYHIQKSTSVFVIRTFISENIRRDLLQIKARPEDYPSLRLLENNTDDVLSRLKFFMVEDLSQAEIIHDQLHNRRFPIHEEMMCNLSDPGFSWWLTKKDQGFQLSFTLSVTDEYSIKIGPLGDRELAVKNFQALESLVTSAGIGMNIENETNRVQFTDCEEFLLEELKDIFEFGVVTETLKDLFKLLSRKSQDHMALETTWFYLNELAAMRRFWIQIQFDLEN